MSSIQDAVGLFFALPNWFFRFNPSDPVGMLQATGTISLVAGILLMSWHRRWALLVFLLPIALCQILVLIAGLMKGEGAGTIATLFLLAFLGVQFLLIGYFIYLARGTRLAASCLGVFCIMYSLHAWLVAAMSFSDTWL